MQKNSEATEESDRSLFLFKFLTILQFSCFIFLLFSLKNVAAYVSAASPASLPNSSNVTSRSRENFKAMLLQNFSRLVILQGYLCFSKKCCFCHLFLIKYFSILFQKFRKKACQQIRQ